MSEPMFVLLTTDGEKLMRQSIPSAWEKKPVRKLLMHVASSLLGQNEHIDLRCMASDGETVPLSEPICSAMTSGGTYFFSCAPSTSQLNFTRGDAHPSAARDEPPPRLSPRLAFTQMMSPLRSAASDYSLYTAVVTTPSGAELLATIKTEGDAAGVYYMPTQAGLHQMQLSWQGTRVGTARTFTVGEGVEAPRPWAEIPDEEQDSFLRWIGRRLASAGLGAVLAVASTSHTCPVTRSSPTAAIDVSDTFLDTPPDVPPEKTLLVFGVVADSMWPSWAAIGEVVLSAVPDVVTLVVPGEVSLFETGEEDIRALCKQLQGNYTRSHALDTHRAAPSALVGQSTLRVMSSKLSVAIAAAAKPAGFAVHLALSSFTEQWVHSRCPQSELVGGVQLEGFAPACLYADVATAIISARLAVTDLDGGHLTAPTIKTSGVLWPLSAAQGVLHARRRSSIRVDDPPAARLAAEGALHTQYALGRAQQAVWLHEVEGFCRACVPSGGLGSLLAERDNVAPAPAHAHDAWCNGRVRLSAHAPIDYYPTFLSEQECDAVMRLGLDYATPCFAADGACHGAVVQLPIAIAHAHDLVIEIERRCAEATGVPVHSDEAALMMRHSLPSRDGDGRRVVDSLHLDTNNNKRHRCATVIIYLSDVAEGCGGETVFPIANAEDDSVLVAAGASAISQGLTAIEEGDRDSLPPPLRALKDAAETDGLGVRVRPRRGAACCFWTLDANQHRRPDPRSWHGGTRVTAGGGGKWIVQKFKELPVEQRC